MALVELADCIPAEEVPEDTLRREGIFGDFSPGRYAWVLRDLRTPVAPFPVKGAQGLFRVRLEGRMFVAGTR